MCVTCVTFDLIQAELAVVADGGNVDGYRWTGEERISDTQRM